MKIVEQSRNQLPNGSIQDVKSETSVDKKSVSFHHEGEIDASKLKQFLPEQVNLPNREAMAPFLQGISQKASEPENQSVLQALLGAAFNPEQFVDSLNQLAKAFETNDLNMALRSVTGWIPNGTIAQGKTGDSKTTTHFQTQGSSSSPLGNVSGSARGLTHTQFDAQGQIGYQDGKLTAQGQASAEAKARLEAQGRFDSTLLQARGNASLEASAGANASGTATLDFNNLDQLLNVQGDARVGARLRAEVNGSFETIGLPVLGENININGNVHGYAEVSAEAWAHVDAGLGIAPPKAVINADVGAFAGAKAGVEGTIGLGGFLSVTGKAEAWAGAGAEAGIVAGYDDGKIRFGFNAGAALEVGAGTSVVFEVDVKKIGDFALKAATLPLQIPGMIIGSLLGGGEAQSAKAMDIGLNPLLLFPQTVLNNVFAEPGEEGHIEREELPLVVSPSSYANPQTTQLFSYLANDLLDLVAGTNDAPTQSDTAQKE